MTRAEICRWADGCLPPWACLPAACSAVHPATVLGPFYLPDWRATRAVIGQFSGVPSQTGPLPTVFLRASEGKPMLLSRLCSLRRDFFGRPQPLPRCEVREPQTGEAAPPSCLGRFENMRLLYSVKITPTFGVGNLGFFRRDGIRRVSGHRRLGNDRDEKTLSCSNFLPSPGKVFPSTPESYLSLSPLLAIGSRPASRPRSTCARKG